MKSRRGVALLTVIVGLAAIAAVVVALTRTAALEARGTGNLILQARAQSAAEAGLAIAIKALVDDALVAGEISFDGFDMRITSRDAAGLIDLNAARPELLQGLLVGIGLRAGEAAAVMAAIADWIDGDDVRRSGGSERSAYRAAGLAYTPRNAPMESVAELKLIDGFPPALYRRLLPFITVHAGTSGIDPASAPPQVLAAMPRGTSAEAFTTPPTRQVFAVDVALRGAGGVQLMRRSIVSLRQGGSQPWQVVAQYDLDDAAAP